MLKRIIKIIILITICLTSSLLLGQEIDSLEKNNETMYTFIVMDSPNQLFTMKQFNQNYMSGYRLLSLGLNNIIENKRICKIIQTGLSIVFIPLTHEEGHRAILTANKIGSISSPFFSSQGVAMVIGVRDDELIKLRNNNLPDFIRLHTAGLESDYMLTRRAETLISLEKENREYVKWEYLMRKVSLVSYYLTGLFKYDPDVEEDKDELKRDIVGHDIYGAVRHLFRPTMDFYRYTKYNQLFEEEKEFVKRAGFKSLLNLLNPIIFGYDNFTINKFVNINIGFGYTLAPFGDLIDQNVWLKINKNYNFHFYFRQFQNKSNWSFGFGAKLVEYMVTDNLCTSVSLHYWKQPKNLDFHTDSFSNGGAIEVDLDYNLFNQSEKSLKWLSLHIGIIYKSFGFLPEEMMMDEHFGIKLGTSIKF